VEWNTGLHGYGEEFLPITDFFNTHRSLRSEPLNERYGDLSPTDKEDSPYGRVELSFHTEAGTCQF
jgi:hypothetical protein